MYVHTYMVDAMCDNNPNKERERKKSGNACWKIKVFKLNLEDFTSFFSFLPSQITLQMISLALTQIMWTG